MSIFEKLSVDEKLAKIEAIVYDIEIVAAIPVEGEIRDNTLTYCNGWQDYEGMGISVVTAYDFVERAYQVYLLDNLHEFKTLVNSRRCLIGFNNERFDNQVLRANDFFIPPEKSWDNHKAITDRQPPGQKGGYSLQSLLKANSLPVKTGLGSEAPKLAQTGQWGKLINYCLSDTSKQVQILRLSCAGTLRNPKTSGYIEITPPWAQFKVNEGLF